MALRQLWSKVKAEQLQDSGNKRVVTLHRLNGGPMSLQIADRNYTKQPWKLED